MAAHHGCSVPRTESGRGIPYSQLQELISVSPARRKLVVLDLALDILNPIDRDRFAIPGATVLLYAPARIRQTGALISALTDTLVAGIPDGPELLDAATLFDHLLPQRRLRKHALHITGELGDDPLALGPNPAHPHYQRGS